MRVGCVISLSLVKYLWRAKLAPGSFRDFARRELEIFGGLNLLQAAQERPDLVKFWLCEIRARVNRGQPIPADWFQ